MPARGIAAHFTASGKASLARSRGGSDDKSKPRAKAKATNRLRTPEAGEVEKIMAETPAVAHVSESVPPEEANQSGLLGSPTPPSPLLDATQRTPISVRTDPDTGKMFLLMSRSSPRSTTPRSSPSKRKAEKSPLLSASPSKTPRVRANSARQLITGEHEEPGSIEEDGLVLTPGRASGTRIALGSPHKSPLATAHQTSTLRRVSQEQDEENYLTPRSIRQKPKGLTLPPLATQTAAAIFRSGHSGDPKPVSHLSTSVSLPSLAQQPVVKSEQEVVAQEAALPEPEHQLSPDLPLPEYYASLMKLHEALEHALVFQLATAGCSSASLQHNDASDSASDNDDLPARVKSERKPRNSVKTVRLPNLITYSVLRPRVEQSGKRRLGPTELKRLASVWLNFPSSSQTDADASTDEVKGLGLLISKTRTEDSKTGRKMLDWGIGIELEVKRVHRERTPPPQLGFGGLESATSSPVASAAVTTFDPSVPGTPKAPCSRFTTPPSSPSLRQQRAPPSSPSLGRRAPPSPSKLDRSPGGARLLRSPAGKTRSTSSVKAREGMSVVAMWSNGLEIRKAEVARRLRDRCGRYHQLWLTQQGIAPPSTSIAIKKEEGDGVEKSDAVTPDLEADEERKAVMGAGGLWTPSATRSGGRRAGKRTFALDPSELDSDHDLSESEEAPPESILSALPNASVGDAKRAMMNEVDSAVVRTPRSKVVADSHGLPPAGSVLHSWHAKFDLNNPAVVMPVPMAKLPDLTEARNSGAAGSGVLLATPRRNKELFGLGIGNLSTPRKPVKFTQVDIPAQPSTPSSSATPVNSVAAMRERLQAKENLRKSQSMSSILSTGGNLQSRKAIMPRLENVSRILFMLFSNGTTRSSSGVWMSPRKPMSEVLDTLARSLNSQFSRIECKEAVDMLAEIAPGFLVVFQAGVHDSHQWVKMGTNQDGQQWTASQVKRQIDQVKGR